jgi:hypothetical protein
MLDAQLKWTILSNREGAIAQQVTWWTRLNGPEIRNLQADEQAAKMEFESYDASMRARWGSQLKRLGQLRPEKGAQANRFNDRTRAEIAKILRECDAGFELEYVVAKIKIRDDVFRSMPLPEAKIFDMTTVRGRVEKQEQEIRLAAQDDLVRAQRASAIADQENKIYSTIARKWIEKSRRDIQAKLTILEAEFLGK